MFYRAIATSDLSDSCLYRIELKKHFKKTKPDQKTKALNTKMLGSFSFTLDDLWSVYITFSFSGFQSIS